MSVRKPVIWDADAHTIAKIEILKAYLQAWFRILGATKKDQTILYVDGFAGPGYYKNHSEGSPLAALRVAQRAIVELGPRFIAKKLHGAFIETNKDRFQILAEVLTPFEKNPSLGITKKCCDFVQGIREIKNEVPGPFNGEGPLFVFADPFGGTDIPFSTFAECMESNTAELLINLDADGIGRIFFADTNNNRDQQLTELFGSECWRTELTGKRNLKRLSVQILDLYKKRLRTLPDVKFIWSFAMRGKNDTLNYHLVFATKHALGLEKMKEAMKVIDKSGAYSFSDAHIEQQFLFRADNEGVYAETMFKQFDGMTITWEDAHLFALNETPFLNPSSMLQVLERLKRVEVDAYNNVPRKAGSFPKEKVRALRFGEFGLKDTQENFSF